MDVADLIKARLDQLGYEQKELAAAVWVTPSFISQLLKKKKSPPAPSRTDIYRKMERFLKLPSGDLAKLAELQNRQERKRKFDSPTVPLFREVRDLLLRKCVRAKRREMSQIFEKEPFGEIERIITQKLLDVAKEKTKQGWNNGNWLRLVARANHKSYEEMRVIVLEFLDSDIFSLSIQNAIYFVGPLIESWNFDLVTFEMTIVLKFSPNKERLKRFAFVEIETEESFEQSGLKDFLNDPSLGKNITEQELKFLRQLKFNKEKPNALYYYRELQNLRDPLHFVQHPVKR